MQPICLEAIAAEYRLKNRWQLKRLCLLFLKSLRKLKTQTVCFALGHIAAKDGAWNQQKTCKYIYENHHVLLQTFMFFRQAIVMYPFKHHTMSNIAVSFRKGIVAIYTKKLIAYMMRNFNYHSSFLLYFHLENSPLKIYSTVMCLGIFIFFVDLMMQR